MERKGNPSKNSVEDGYEWGRTMEVLKAGTIF